jgi:hypothetical protein
MGTFLLHTEGDQRRARGRAVLHRAHRLHSECLSKPTGGLGQTGTAHTGTGTRRSLTHTPIGPSGLQAAAVSGARGARRGRDRDLRRHGDSGRPYYAAAPMDHGHGGRIVWGAKSQTGTFETSSPVLIWERERRENGSGGQTVDKARGVTKWWQGRIRDTLVGWSSAADLDAEKLRHGRFLHWIGHVFAVVHDVAHSIRAWGSWITRIRTAE